MKICQWVYLFILLVASQLCATFGDVGVDASCADKLDCGIVDGNTGIIVSHDDDDSSIENDPTEDNAIDMDSFIKVSVAQAGRVKHRGIIDTFFGTIHQAEKCFEEVDSVLGELHAASPPATTIEETSTVATDAAGNTTTAWFFCAHTESLIQMDPVVLASYANALTLSPLFIEHDGGKKDDFSIDGFLNDIFFDGASPLCAEAKSDANGGGLEAVDACYYAISDSIGSNSLGGGSSSDIDDGDGMGHDLQPSRPRPSVIPYLDRTLGPSMDPSPISSDNALHASASPIEPSLFIFGEARDDPAQPMDPSLFHATEAHHALTPAFNSSLFVFEEARPTAPSAMGPSLLPLDDDAHHVPTPPMDPYLFSLGREGFVETVPQRKLRGAAMKDDMESEMLAKAYQAVAVDEPFEVEAFIVASKRREEETKARRKVEELSGGNYVAQSILGVAEDVAVFVGDLLVEFLPDWMNPIAGLIEWADECFLDADKMPVRPDWNPHDFKIKRSPSDSLDGLDDFGDGGYEGTGWFFCVPKNRFVQQDPILVCPDNALTGRRVATSSPSLQTEHIHDASGDINDDFSPVDAIVAVDYALYVAEHMQLALYNPPESYLPAAAAARLARHIAELADEHSALEIVFERFFARDQEEAEQVALYETPESYLPAAAAARLARHIAELADEHSVLEAVFEKFFARDQEEEERVAIETQMIEKRATETRIMIQMQNLLSGGGGKTLQEEEALAPIDECTPLETLQGNDHYASSRSDCHLYLPPVSVCYTPVSIEDNNSFFYDAKTPFSAMSGSQCIAPRLDQPRTAEERLFAFLRGVGTAVNRRLQGVSSSGALLIVGCLVFFLGAIIVVGELRSPTEDQISMTASELNQMIAAAVAKGVQEREETLREEFGLELDLLRIAGGVLHAGAEESFWKVEGAAGNELKEGDHGDLNVGIKQEGESSSPQGKKKKRHRAGRKHKKSSMASEKGLSGGGVGVGREVAKEAGGGDSGEV